MLVGIIIWLLLLWLGIKVFKVGVNSFKKDWAATKRKVGTKEERQQRKAEYAEKTAKNVAAVEAKGDKAISAMENKSQSAINKMNGWADKIEAKTAERNAKRK